MRLRLAVAAVVISGLAPAAAALPASADSGRLMPLPGLAGSNASCVGATSDFSAHYGITGDSFPKVVHGQVGPNVSEDATTLPPGSVGQFQSMLATNHGTVMACVP